MSQQAMNRDSQQSIHIPFRVKSAGVSLVIILMIGAYYVANALSLPQSDEAVPDGALSLVLTAIILSIVVQTVLQSVLFIGAGQIENRTERDNAGEARASRNAYIMMTLGAFATVGSMFAGFTPFEMGNILVIAFLLAETVKSASQIVYYRRAA